MVARLRVERHGSYSGFLGAIVGIQGRLICNLLDGMVAIEGGRKSKSGEIWNDFPDRLADPLVLAAAGYVAAIPWLGIYLASALLIAGFMRWIGRYGWLLTSAISIGLPVIVYITFEIWFLVPLPKGPLEDLLGL